MKFLPEPIRRMARESVAQPLSSPVASDVPAYLEGIGEPQAGLARLSPGDVTA